MKNIRVFYRKAGRLKYISHLDMNRVFSRMLRRTDVPVWYTEGFNPHLRTNFALPLSLGFESDWEVVDIRVDDDNYLPEDMLLSLQAVQPEGLDFFAAAEPVMKVGDIGWADFDVYMQLPNGAEDFFAQPVIEVEKKTKKGGVKTVDIKPLIKAYSCDDGVLHLTLAAGNDNLNPTLVISAMSAYVGEQLKTEKIVRRMFYNLSGEKFV